MVRRPGGGGAMTLAEAEDIADEQITYWRVRQSAHQSLRDLGKEHGGGWDRVRAALIRKALEMDEQLRPQPMRRAA
jgi:hypothetical protein